MSPSIKTHSSMRPPVLLCPLELCFAAKISIVELFLNTYFTLSFDLTVFPFSQFISLPKAGIKVHISSILAIVIEAACSFSFVILKAFYPLVLTLTYSCKLSISFHPRLTLGLIGGEPNLKEYYIFLCRSLVGRLYLFTTYALPLTKLNLAFGSGQHFSLPA